MTYEHRQRLAAGISTGAEPGELPDPTESVLLYASFLHHTIGD